MIKYNKINFQKGLTLIGVVVSVSLLASAAVVITRMVVETERLAAVSREKFVAISLAREGLELARVVRDTNELGREGEDRNWVRFLCGDIVLYHEVVDNWLRGQALNPTGGTTTNPIFDSYDRVINVNCQNQDSDEAHIIVTSQVYWQHHGEIKSVVIREILYDWL